MTESFDRDLAGQLAAETDAIARSARTEDYARGYAAFFGDDQRVLLLDLLAQEGERMVDGDGSTKTLRLEGRPPQAAGTRFTALERAAKARRQFEGLADGLTARHDVASAVTYTLPRECVPSVYESVEVVREALTRLHRDRFGYSPVGRPRPDGVPDYVAVLEPQRDLTAHLHVAYGGEERVMAEADLRADWADLLDAPASKPPQVRVQTLSLDSDDWRVTAEDGEPVESYGGIREYFGAGTRSLTTLAGMAPDDLHGLADDLRNGALGEDARGEAWDLAGLALPWATGTWFTTGSNGLRAT